MQNSENTNTVTTFLRSQREYTDRITIMAIIYLYLVMMKYLSSWISRQSLTVSQKYLSISRLYRSIGSQADSVEQAIHSHGVCQIWACLSDIIKRAVFAPHIGDWLHVQPISSCGLRLRTMLSECGRGTACCSHSLFGELICVHSEPRSIRELITVSPAD